MLQVTEGGTSLGERSQHPREAVPGSTPASKGSQSEGVDVLQLIKAMEEALT